MEAVAESASSDCSKNERSLSGEKDTWSSLKDSVKMVSSVSLEAVVEGRVENLESKAVSLSSS